VLTHRPWNAVPGLQHGFLDAAECAAPEWETVLARAGVRLPLALPRQVHGSRALSAVSAAARPEADALATATPGLLVGVVTADCMPVLLADRRRRVAAAVHAGWRGAAAGVLEAAVEHLSAAFGAPAGELDAVIGPAIAGCCYEVGAEVLDAFRARAGDTTAPAWTRRGGRHHLDLRSAARCLLEAAGVRSVAVLGPCTACGAGYHSYRRDGARAGRQVSFAGWE
jgi:YfiH family protein